MKTVSSAQKSRNCYRQLLEEVCEDDPVFHVIDSIGTEVGKWEFQGQRGEYFRLNSALQNSRKKVFKVSVTAREIDPGKICSFGTRNSDRRNWCCCGIQRKGMAMAVGVACQEMSGHINYEGARAATEAIKFEISIPDRTTTLSFLRRKREQRDEREQRLLD